MKSFILFSSPLCRSSSRCWSGRLRKSNVGIFKKSPYVCFRFWLNNWLIISAYHCPFKQAGRNLAFQFANATVFLDAEPDIKFTLLDYFASRENCHVVRPADFYKHTGLYIGICNFLVSDGTIGTKLILLSFPVIIVETSLEFLYVSKNWTIR